MEERLTTWPPPLQAHLRQNGAGHAQQAEDIRFKLAQDFRIVGFLDRTGQAVAGVVHEDINAFELGNGLLHHGGDIERIAQVQGDGEQAITGLRKRGGDFLRIARGGENRITALKGSADEFAAKTLGRAGDEPYQWFVGVHIFKKADRLFSLQPAGCEKWNLHRMAGLSKKRFWSSNRRAGT